MHKGSLCSSNKRLEWDENHSIEVEGYTGSEFMTSFFCQTNNGFHVEGLGEEVYTITRNNFVSVIYEHP